MIFLTSKLNWKKVNENGEKEPTAIKDENKILTNIKKYLPAKNRVVIVANNPFTVAENDERKVDIFKSLKLSKLEFKEKILLDSRNMKDAKSIIGGADLVLLSGGKCLVENKFFKKINLKKLIKHSDAVFVGMSAGSMNLCKTVCNFPEDEGDLSEPRWFKGLGFTKENIIPHFDGKTKTYQTEVDINLVDSYILPASFKRELLAMPNGSYIMIDKKGKHTYFGPMYKIFKGEVTKINKNK